MKTKNKLLPSESGTPGTMSYGESPPGYSITIAKRLNVGLRLQLLGKNLNFTKVTHINQLTKIELRGPGPPGF